jgi:hypothetical protein
MVNGSKTLIGSQVAGSVVTGQWYDIRIVLNGPRIQCFLNNQLVQDVQYPGFPHGAVGLGTWNTQASYANLVVTNATGTLYQSDFTSAATGWQVYNGAWSTSGGLYQQTAITTDCRSTTGDTNWNSYTLTLKARKDGGNEGFLILFNWLDNNNWTWWNIGGWNNTQHGIEQMVNGTKTLVGTQVQGSVTANQWYDIRIVLTGRRIQCYLNNQLIHDVSYSYSPTLLASATYAAARGQLILKTVNVSSQPVPTQLAISAGRGLASNAALTLLTSGSTTDENSLAQPAKVSPVTTTFSGAGTNFSYSFPANSLSVFRLQALPDFPVGISLAATNQQTLASLSNGVLVQLSSFITNNVSVTYTVDSPPGLLTSGTLSFRPGDLAKALPLVFTNVQSSGLVRVTLSNPMNGQLSGATRAYYVQTLNNPSDPPVLALAFFPDETLLYWSDTAATLLRAPSLAGPWITLSSTTSPFQLSPSGPQAFFRLKR